MKAIFQKSLIILVGLALVKNTLAQAPVISYPGNQTYYVGSTELVGITNTGGQPGITGYTTTLAGNGTTNPIANGLAASSNFNQPLGIVVDAAGNIYVSDDGHEVIRKITPGGIVSTFAGESTPSHDDGTGTSAGFYHPVGMCVDPSGSIYVADEDNNLIRKMTPQGVVTTIAGTRTAGFANGTALSATFNLPCGVALDPSGNLYVADYGNNAIRKIDPSGNVTTFAGGTQGSANGTGTAASFYGPYSLACDATGNVYVADRLNNLVREITPAGLVTTLAGSGSAGSANGTGPAASFNHPTTITIDPQNNIYVADQFNNRIRMITPASLVTNLSGTTAGSTNGNGSAAQFSSPIALTADAFGNLFVCDYSNNLIRQVQYSNYSVSPALPLGLLFNTSNGVISGIPTTPTAAAGYNITAYSASGNSSTSLSINVKAATIINPSNTINYIATYTPRISGITTSTALNAASAYNIQEETNVQYFDGLGRPLQTVQAKGSPSQSDMVQAYTYDALGREATKYLPYTVNTTNPGAYQTTALSGTAGYSNSAQYLFYQQNYAGYVTTPFPNAQTIFEPSPLNRVVEQGAPGDNWQPTSATGNPSTPTSPGHTTKVSYAGNDQSTFSTTPGSTNTGSRMAALYTATTNSDMTRSLVGNGTTTTYATGTLFVTIGMDENWNSGADGCLGTTETYKDMTGHVVLKRAYNLVGTTLQMLSTYYVYDEFDNLAFVLPPGVSPDLPNNPLLTGTVLQTTLDNLCYQYRYDARGRLAQKKLPGKGWESIIYNVIDKPIATQDAVQAGNGNWTITKYDVLGRPVLSGVWNSAGNISPANLQSTISTKTTNLWEAVSNTGNGYTNAAWPTSGITANLGINYYDSYANIPNLPAAYNQAATASQRTRNLPVAKLTGVLNSPDMLWDVMYYDDLGRSTNTFAQHYLGGVNNTNNYDAVATTYNFTNAPTTVTRKHFNNTNSAATPIVTIGNAYIYDQMGRKLKTWEQITNGTSVPTQKTLISQMVYNEVGQALNKQLHCTDSVTFLQNIAYTYNERGWLTFSIAPLFAMQLQYNTGSSKSYNGNIMYQYFGVQGNLSNHYVYAYDRLNRLTAGATAVDLYKENGITYDSEGNIMTMNRYQAGAQIDQLSYTYNDVNGNPTNQLQTVNDGIGSSTTLQNGITNYTYDLNGNMVTAANTNPAKAALNKSFSYNILNLPVQSNFNNGSAVYTYDATGTKLRKVSTMNGITTVTDYIGGIQYKTNSTVIDFIQTEQGKAVLSSTGNNYDYYYNLGDNLGNTRVTFDSQTTPGSAYLVQQDDYYPFGLEINRTSYSPKNEYLYNKKELQEEFTEYDYGARFYDPVVARWTSVDPMAEKSRRFSPYNYVENNPIRFIDPDGMLTDYYNLDGENVKHVEDGSSDKVIVLTSSSRASKVDAAIASGQVVADPSNEVLNKMDAAYAKTEATGNESGFVVATDGSSTALKSSGSSGLVKLATGYETLADAGKTSSYDVHVHPFGPDAGGNYGAPIPSGTKGGTPDKKGDTDTYGKEGPNNRPSVVLGYSVTVNTTTSMITSGDQPHSTTTTTATKQIGFYNGNGQVGKPVDYDKFKKAVQKINGQ